MIAGELTGADGVDADVGLWIEKRNVLGPGFGAALTCDCTTGNPPIVDGGPDRVWATFSKFSFEAYGEMNFPPLKYKLAYTGFSCIAKDVLTPPPDGSGGLLTGGVACRCCFSGLLKVLVLKRTSSFTDERDELLDRDPDLFSRASGDFDFDGAVPFICDEIAWFVSVLISICFSAPLAVTLSIFSFFEGGSSLSTS